MPDTVQVTAQYLGNHRTEISIGQRTCILENHRDAEERGASLCPTELLAASVAG